MKEEALKLADELQTASNGSIWGGRTVKEGADMIRKLVAELDKHQDKSLDELMKWQQELDKQGELVAEIDTYRLKNSNQIDTYRHEPVAWMYERPNGAKKIAWVREPHDKNVLKEIPLYTAPQTKPLSDEEIHMLIGLHIPVFNEPKYDDLIKFARAIEERHGIK